jgi:L-lactate dehydrogenase complex protein LldG
MQSSRASRNEILGRLRQTQNSLPEIEVSPSLGSEYPFKSLQGSLAEIFCSQLKSIGGRCYLVYGNEAVKSLLQDIVEELGSPSRIFIGPGADVSLPSSCGTEFCSGSQISGDSPVSVTTCECLSARTGTVVVSSATSGGRKLHSFAETHIVLASASQLVADLPDAFSFLCDKYGGAFPSAVTFITGQSRTADIEKTLVLGAHGPKTLIVIIQS